MTSTPRPAARLLAGISSRTLLRLAEVVPLFAFRGLQGGMPILIGLYLGHQWGLAVLGAYTFAFSIVAVGLVFVDWGCTRWLPRELALARQRGSGLDAAASANGVRLAIAGASLLLTYSLIVTGFIPAQSARFAMELAFLYPIAIFTANGVSDRIVTREIGGIAVALVAEVAVFAAAAWLLAGTTLGPHGVVLAYLAAKVAEAVLLMAGRSELFRVSLRHALRTVTALWPFSIQAILGVIYSRLSIFVVQRYLPQDLGLMGAASALQSILLLLPLSVALLNYPLMTTAAARGERAGIGLIVRRAAALSALVVSAGVMALFLGRGMVGGALHIPPERMPFVVAYVSISVLSIGTTLAGVLLQSLSREHAAARLSFLTLGMSILLQFTLVRGFGLWGLTLAVATAEVLSLAIFGVAAWRGLCELPASGASQGPGSKALDVVD